MEVGEVTQCIASSPEEKRDFGSGGLCSDDPGGVFQMVCTVKRMWNAEISLPSTRSGAEAPSWHLREFFSAVLSRHKLSEVGASNLQRTAKP